MTRRHFVGTLAAGAGSIALARNRSDAARPNIVLILADDLGYGDAGCYGARFATPNIDRLAADGVRFTDFYSASPVCSPSRAAILTGRYPVRTGVTGVLQAADPGGLPASEVTLAQVLRGAGYTSACIGKWHLGAQPGFLPCDRGFDEYFGIPYSNDMSPLPLLRNADTVDPSPDPTTFTARFTEEAVAFIQRSKASPFFLYLAHSAPHIPLAPGSRFRGASAAGPYGDSVQELDWGVGEVLTALRDVGVEDRTLVVFMSDNGPWYQGSAGPLRGRKAETWDGGMRVPFIARYPGVIPPGTVSTGIGTALDLLPTVARMAGAPQPSRPLDGIDIAPLLTGERDRIDRPPFLYFDGGDLQCARFGRWKVHFSRYLRTPWNPDPPGGCMNLPLPSPELYDMTVDPGESYDTAPYHPEVVADIRSRLEEILPSFPEGVRTAWTATMRQPVEYSPPGALPIRKKP